MTIGNLAKLLIYIVSSMSQLFILCWKGDRLIEFVSINVVRIIFYPRIGLGNKGKFCMAY